ncbi:putative spermidine/putrescine transport system ATP-binding protein [Albimonas donghaensis]|uniref:Putative spermidine/putrescine transport system ATP-binding protein n=1 Tax=Albimonas donghaensis TaxID=356660 RepID=A0A1H3CHH8_9RHOB|nr:ABC transporter ATP-binding protein [Albimonas donghaensis]SDX53565.1 putative spermidine/putrescine transport system ATP-binding protein [Albimonas donghaensis]
MSQDATLELVALTKRYGDALAVDRIDLKVASGAYCCLLGPSGCGKSTTLRMIAGHESASDGDVMLGGKRVTGLPPARRGTSMMFQSYALFPHLSIADNVAFSLKMKGVARAERLARAAEMLALVDMTAFADRLPAQLSGGQQQRVALARSLITRPQALLLDEPLSALDPFLRVRMRGELKKIQRELGLTFVHVTHSQDEALALADLVVVMNAGRIEQAAPAREVFGAPRTEFVARFIGGHNVVDDGSGPVAVRADRIAVMKGGMGLPATVRDIEYLGATVSVALQADQLGELTAVLPDGRFFADPVAPGEQVMLAWKPEDAHRLAA